jgi:hypothetical protein
VPLAILAISLFSGYRHSSLGKTKLAWLVVECLLLLPVFVLTCVGAYYRKREAVDLKPIHTPGRRKWLPFLVFAVILVPLAFRLDRGTYQGDENAYLFQARCLNAGGLYTSVPPRIPLSAITYDHHVIVDGRWSGKYPPGWPLLLSIGTATHLAWLVNPLVALGLIWLTFQMGAKSFGQSSAVCSAWILALSAYYSMNSLGFMSHTFSGLLVAAAVFCCLESSKSKSERQRRLWIAGAFICLTGTSAVRPFTALCAGMAIVAALNIRANWSAIGRLLLGGVLWGGVVIASMGIQNRLITGSYLKSPYNPGGQQMSEISVRPADLAHNMIYVTSRRLLDTASTGFPCIYLLALCGLWRRRRERFAWMLALVFLSVAVGYTVEVVDSDSPIGERYHFEGYFAIALLAGDGWLYLVKAMGLSARIRRNAIAAAFAACVAIIGLCAYWEVGLRWTSRQLMKAADHPPAHTDLVFVEGYGSIPPWRLNFNTPGSKTLFVHDPGPSRRAAFAQMAARPNWICLYYDPAKDAAGWSKAGDQSARGWR